MIRWLPLLAGLVIMPAGAAAQTIDRVMASVSGRIVTLSDVRAAREFGLVPGARDGANTRTVLDRLIDRILMLEEVERYAPPEPDTAAVRERFNAIRTAFPTAEAFEAALRVSGMDETALGQWIRNDLRIRAYLDQRFAAVLEPTGEELENYLRQLRSDGPGTRESLDDERLRALARERAVADRRQALIRDWIDGLRRRSSVTYTEPPQ
jgi:hypothetical protein